MKGGGREKWDVGRGERGLERLIKNGNCKYYYSLFYLLRDDAVATAELNEFILSRVCAQISPHRTNPNLVSSLA